MIRPVWPCATGRWRCIQVGHIEHMCDILVEPAPSVRRGRRVTPIIRATQPSTTTSLSPEETVTAAGLSADPAEYQRRLDEQPDAQIDSWVIELMRDMSIRTGVLSVLEEFGHACGLD